MSSIFISVASLLMLSISAFASDRSCDEDLTAAFLQQSALNAARDLHAALGLGVEALQSLKLWRGEDWITVLGSEQVAEQVSMSFSLAIDLRARGMDDQSNEEARRLATFLRNITGRKINAFHLQNEIEAVATNPVVERNLFMAEFMQKDIPPLEIGLLDKRSRESEPFTITPVTLDVIKLAYQYGKIVRSSRVLYVGPDERAVAVGLGLHAPGQRQILTLDPGYVLPPDAGEIESLRQHGPYQLVVLVNATTTGHAWFAGKPVEVAKTLRSLLAPSGVLILLNDFGARPAFNEAKAEAAGFDIVRWNLGRSVAPEVRNALPHGDQPGAGDLRAFVLRNGPELKLERPKFNTMRL